MTLLINNHGFCPQLSYLIGEVGLSRGGGIVSVIRFTPLSSTLTPARKYTNANDELPEVGGSWLRGNTQVMTLLRLHPRAGLNIDGKAKATVGPAPGTPASPHS